MSVDGLAWEAESEEVEDDEEEGGREQQGGDKGGGIKIPMSRIELLNCVYAAAASKGFMPLHDNCAVCAH